MDTMFAIPGLFETILLYLGTEALLISVQRVNKAWNNFIDTSVPIQQALFMCPNPRHANSASIQDDRHLKINPFLKRRFGNCVFETGTYDGYFLRANSFYAMPWTFDHRKADEIMDNSKGRRPQGLRPANLTPLELHKIRIASQKMRRKGASWRRMLVCRPPPSYLGYLYTNNIGSNPLDPIMSIESALIDFTKEPGQSPGLRMGALYDFVQARAGQYASKYTSFRVIWSQPQEPMRSVVVEERCRRLLQQNSVVVEIQHARGVPVDAACDAEVFNKRFRSKDYRDLQVESVQKESDPEYHLSLWDQRVVEGQSM